MREFYSQKQFTSRSALTLKSPKKLVDIDTMVRFSDVHGASVSIESTWRTALAAQEFDSACQTEEVHLEDRGVQVGSTTLNSSVLSTEYLTLQLV